MRILLIEDERELANALTVALSKHDIITGRSSPAAYDMMTIGLLLKHVMRC
ncbi:hypothetical protein SAMN05216228_10178 [Rhizobium tibeticum]|uniref:Uncharacterized protein n=1 Tax=Rhizobium tibeticum TaxID=501024 RepID=A0A1H8PKL3_9HYPH|nr:hypothetical protein [Rhizobium tibeticum]SEH97777.1 hypothetical protein RTCCBAU85039_3447 [Rhizobium tibeticum]SEO42326.1 hypothetical protein SAMN05216228_10178 [Rhizobium tibeticum]